MNIKNLLNDSIKTVISSVIYMVIFQFIFFPYLSRKYGAHDFGIIITIYSLVTLFSVIVGSTLNNVRLLNDKKFKQQYISYEFIKLFAIASIIVEILLSSILIFYFSYSFIQVLSICYLLLLLNLKNYLQVYLRINLSYNKLFFLVLLQSITLLILIQLNKTIVDLGWETTLVLTELTGVIYIIMQIRNKNARFYYDKNKYLHVRNHYTNLAFINLINNIIIYFDRFILLIMLNAKSVTIIFLVTFVGKLFAGFVFPINSVLLSYLTKSNLHPKKLLNWLTLASIVLIIISTLSSYPLSYIVIKYLYHSNFIELKKYIILANLGVIMSVVGNILFVFNMKYVPVKFQSKSQILFFITYFIITIPLTYGFGIMGFILSVIISNSIKLISIYYYGREYSEVE